MTDGASGRSIDELRPSNNDPRSAIAMGLVMLLTIVLSGMAGYSMAQNKDCPSEWKRAQPIHKHEIAK